MPTDTSRISTGPTTPSSAPNQAALAPYPRQLEGCCIGPWPQSTPIDPGGIVVTVTRPTPGMWRGVSRLRIDKRSMRAASNRSSRESSVRTRYQPGAGRVRGSRSATKVTSSTNVQTNAFVASRTSNPWVRCRNRPSPGTKDGSLSWCHTGRTRPPRRLASSSASTRRLEPTGASNSISKPVRRRSTSLTAARQARA